MSTLRNSGSWRNYRALLADEFAISLRHEPAEERLAVRGHELRVDLWQPPAKPRGTLILVHGGGGNGRLLAPFAEQALTAGWCVLAPDLPGYGLTRPAASFAWDYAEWPAVVAELADRATGPVVLMGLSMGGLTAVAAAQACPKVRAVIATTLLDLSDPAAFDRAARWPWLGRLTRLAMALLPAVLDRLWLPLRFVTPLDAMSSNPRLRRYFRTDRLLGASWKPARFFRTLHQFTLFSQVLPCPLYLLHPGADAWTPTALSLQVFERIQAPKRLVELSNGAHLPLEQPAFAELGEVVRDLLRECETSPVVTVRPGGLHGGARRATLREVSPS